MLKVERSNPGASVYVSKCSLIGFLKRIWARILCAEVVSSAHAQPCAFAGGAMLKIECMLAQRNLQRLLCVGMCLVYS